MEIQVRRLEKNMAEDYLDFFDNRAFSDGNPEKGCYCVWHHWTEEQEQLRARLPESERPNRKREYARELIQDGKLCGFAAFCDGKMVGFCNADKKARYFRLNSPGEEKTLSIVCFTVAPQLRRRGIAKALLQSACRYAQEEGYDCVEGYPSRGEFKVSDCGGPAAMYIEQGFTIAEDGIARKKMDRIQEERLTAEAYIDFLKRTDLGSQYPRERFAERIATLVKSVPISLTARNAAGDLTGVCFCITDFAYWMFITDLGVVRECAGQGIGKALVKRALELAGGEKNIIVYTCPNENAVPFYEKIGMTRTDDMMMYNRVEWTDFTVE